MSTPTPPVGPPTSPLPTQPVPSATPGTGSGATPARKKGWPGSAKVAVAVLAVTTIAAAVTGVVLSSSASSDKDDAEAALEETQADLDASQEELEQTEEELASTQQQLQASEQRAADAESALSDSQSEVASVTAERDEAQASADSLRALFPFSFADFADAPLQGTYRMTLVEGTAECTGYADNAAACAAESLPASIEITGDATAGYSVDSDFFAATPLVRDGGRYSASGQVDEAVADLCNGVVNATSFNITVTTAEVGLTSTDTTTPTLLFVDYQMSTPETADCTATSRDVDFDATPA